MTDSERQPTKLRLLGITLMSDDPVSLYGLELPDWFEAVFHVPGSGKMSVAVYVNIDPDDGPVAAGVRAIGKGFTYRDAVAFLKGAPLDDLLHDASMMAAGAWKWDLGVKQRGKSAFELTDADRAEVGREVADVRARAAAVERPSKRRTMTPDLLRQVAEVYRKNLASGDAPTVGVASHFSVAHRTATRWVSEARKAGFLGSVKGPMPGEVTTPADGATPSE